MVKWLGFLLFFLIIFDMLVTHLYTFQGRCTVLNSIKVEWKAQSKTSQVVW